MTTSHSKRRLVFDIEGNNLLDKITVCHCIVAIDYDTEEQFVFRPHQVEEGLNFLMDHQLLGHNIIGFDLLALHKLFGKSFEGLEVFDSLVASRILDPDRKGGHSLDAWGKRLGCFKGDFGQQENAWEVFTEDMLEYCIQDVVVNIKLIRHLEEQLGDLPLHTMM